MEDLNQENVDVAVAPSYTGTEVSKPLRAKENHKFAKMTCENKCPGSFYQKTLEKKKKKVTHKCSSRVKLFFVRGKKETHKCRAIALVIS